MKLSWTTRMLIDVTWKGLLGGEIILLEGVVLLLIFQWIGWI